jgi:hypothetical protein
MHAINSPCVVSTTPAGDSQTHTQTAVPSAYVRTYTRLVCSVHKERLGGNQTSLISWSRTEGTFLFLADHTVAAAAAAGPKRTTSRPAVGSVRLCRSR